MISEALLCLALNVWHEARGEEFQGQLAVAEVTRRRVEDPRWPDTICEVVYEPWQFSWTMIDMPPPDTSSLSWERAVKAARMSETSETTECSLWYYNPSIVTPAWEANLDEEEVLGSHRFMCDPED